MKFELVGPTSSLPVLQYTMQARDARGIRTDLFTAARDSFNLVAVMTPPQKVIDFLLWVSWEKPT